MKKQLDERQQAAMDRVGARSFSSMFFLGIAVIAVQLVWTGRLEFVLGETLLVLLGGGLYIGGSIRNGCWTKSGEPMTVLQNQLLSAVCSGIFTIPYALIISKKAAEGAFAAWPWLVLLFFVCVWQLGFGVLTILGKSAQKKKEQQEKKYFE